jgi:hypothetical protein
VVMLSLVACSSGHQGLSLDRATKICSGFAAQHGGDVVVSGAVSVRSQRSADAKFHLSLATFLNGVPQSSDSALCGIDGAAVPLGKGCPAAELLVAPDGRHYASVPCA